MSAFERIAVLDIGKTNAKMVIFDAASGAEMEMRRMPNRVLSGPPYPHYDVEALWAFLLETLADFAKAPGFDAISITTHGAAAALIDADGQLALPALDYEHQYPEDIQRAYDEIRPGFAETFSPRLSGGLNLGAQIHYQKSAFPEAFSRVRAILTYPQYWAYRLTGAAANEVTSLGCHTDLWRPHEGRYSSLVNVLDIRDLMAPVHSAFDQVGMVRADIVSGISLPEPVPVFCGIHDSNASLLPYLTERDAPFAVVSTGTWVINFAVAGDVDRLDMMRDALANVDAYGRVVPSARFMGGREFEILTGELGILDQDRARAALPGVIGKRLMLLPNVVAGSGPFPGRERKWVNGQSASADERWAAACLYFALMTETCLDLAGGRGPILVEGPFALNALYLSLLSSLTGRGVFAVPGSTGTSQGAALLAGIKPADRRGVPAVAIDGAGLSGYRADWLASV
ncbi:FGGY-family carbohydrate kinase [Agrobacterium sp. Ap1]|uniref:FGGY-family carbohydrate kinase n=1 Tax=Agrobacterium sp. Ap1 TaxID=2815337 RepID=UPI001A8FC1DF|nr:FGGY-family carbohydrate kinase [Agrobacterium sp. Ap1]MBO0144373.1 FGGY-family carbohydrate kinase [Agrobacterium sp. Ap1]